VLSALRKPRLFAVSIGRGTLRVFVGLVPALVLYVNDEGAVGVSNDLHWQVLLADDACTTDLFPILTPVIAGRYRRWTHEREAEDDDLEVISRGLGQSE
jgi:hypothetical protein